MPSIKQMVANAISGDQKQYLEDISVANIFPDNTDNLKPDGIKRMRTMISDPGVSLLLPTIFSASYRTIKNQFVSFRKKFQVSSRLAEKDLSVAQKADEAYGKMSAELSVLKADMDALEKKFGSVKKEAEEHSTQIFNKDSSQDENVKQLEKLKAKFRELRSRKGTKINDKIKEVEAKIKATEDTQRSVAEKILIEYAGKDEKKKKELLGGKYNWGPFTKSDTAVKAKQAYLLYHGKMAEWKKAAFADALKFLQNPEKFSGGEFQQFHRELVDMDRELEELQSQMEDTQKEIEKEDKERAKLSDKVRELEAHQGDISEYMDKKSKYNSMLLRIIDALGKEKIAFKSVKADSERICGHIEDFLKEYKAEPALADKIKAAKTDGKISTDDSKGGTIPLILVVAKCYYFFENLSENCDKKTETLKTQLEKLPKKLSQNKLIAKREEGTVRKAGK